MPAGVHGTGPGMPSASRPMFIGCMPSTSLSGSIVEQRGLVVDLRRGRVLHEHGVDGRVVVERADGGDHVGLAWRRRAGARAGCCSRAPRALRMLHADVARRWRRRRRRARCRARACARSPTSFSMRGARSANTASATGRPGHEQSSRSRQCRKCRSPVNTIARPSSSALAMTSSSRTEPPGWMITATPASAAASMPSGNG